MKPEQPTIKIIPEDHPQAPQVREWIYKYVECFPILAEYPYNIKIVEKTGPYWDAMVEVEVEVGEDEELVAKLTFREPIQEFVLFHELIHIHLNFVSEEMSLRFDFDYTQVELNRRTKIWINNLYRVFEEWFIELYLFQHIFKHKEDDDFIREFLGKSYNDYLYSLDKGLQDMDDRYFGSLGDCLSAVVTVASSACLDLFYHTLLAGDDRIPDSYRPQSASGINAALVGVLSNYTNLDLLDSAYYRSLFSDFINTVVKHQIGATEKATYVVQHPEKRPRVIFTQTFQLAIDDFNAEMIYLDSIEPKMKKMIREYLQQNSTNVDPMEIWSKVIHTLIPHDLKFTEIEAEEIFNYYLKDLASELGIEIVDDTGLFSSDM